MGEITEAAKRVCCPGCEAAVEQVEEGVTYFRCGTYTSDNGCSVYSNECLQGMAKRIEVLEAFKAKSRAVTLRVSAIAFRCGLQYRTVLSCLSNDEAAACASLAKSQRSKDPHPRVETDLAEDAMHRAIHGRAVKEVGGG